MQDDAASEGTEDDGIFDAELTRTFDVFGQRLAEQSRVLVAEGAASVPIPGGTMRARLRRPRWWRPGLLEVAAQDAASGEIIWRGSEALLRSDRHDAALVEKITMSLAMELTYGPASGSSEPDESSP